MKNTILLSSKVSKYDNETERYYLINDTTLLVCWSNGLSHTREFRTKAQALAYWSITK